MYLSFPNKRKTTILFPSPLTFLQWVIHPEKFTLQSPSPSPSAQPRYVCNRLISMAFSSQLIILCFVFLLCVCLVDLDCLWFFFFRLEAPILLKLFSILYRCGELEDWLLTRSLDDKTARLILREKRFETPTWQEPIKQDRNSGQLFRCYWSSSALSSEDKQRQPKSQRR